MTARDLYEGVLIELNKENAPNIILEDFNYFANKSIYQYINKKYNIYDVNQQTTDDLRVLKATAKLYPTKSESYDGLSLVRNGMATYYVDLPSDYLHILNCICVYNVKKTYKCYSAGDTWRAAATRLTSDAYSQVLDNYWNKPSYKKPYYFIHNINTSPFNPTNPYTYEERANGSMTKVYGTDITEINQANYQGNDQVDSHGNKIAKDWEGITSINLNTDNTGEYLDTYSNVQRSAGIRYGNVSTVRMEIRYGTDNSIFTLDSTDGPGGYIYIDYIKTPQHIRLTQKQIDFTEDTSQVLEFPDYVCQEILNELVHIIMEHISDPRLQTHPVVSQSIANPAQAQTPEAAGQSAQ